MPPQITIYTTSYCGYCRAAKELLSSRGLAFKEIDVTDDEAMRQKLVGMAGGRETVPQIFIDGKSIGGYQELVELVRTGKLAG